MGIVIKKWKKNWKIMVMRGNNNFYLNEYNVNRPRFLNKVYFFMLYKMGPDMRIYILKCSPYWCAFF